MRILEPISETTYLNTTNAVQYRAIMRIFYEESEKTNFQLYKEDVYKKLKENPQFEDYEMEQLKLDLDALVDWKNLTPFQGTKHATTIADYKNKQFRYAISETAVEIERMTKRLEDLKYINKTLSTSTLLRINDFLHEIEEHPDMPSKQLNEWWRNLQEDFRRLNQDYQDYLREFYSGKADKIMKSLEFIIHKDNFIKYLHEFVEDLQKNAGRTARLLKHIAPIIENKVLDRVVESELEIPHSLTEKSSASDQYIKEMIYGRWETFTNWFIGNETAPSEYSRILDITNDIIRRIIQNAALIMQLQNWGISRKDDYKKFIQMFLDCENVKEAHCLSSHVFGIQNVQHYVMNENRSTDSITSSTYEEEAMEYVLNSHTRVFRSKVDKTGFESKAMDKAIQRAKYLDKIEAERAMASKYIKNNVLDISQIQDIIPANLRQMILRWITNANNLSTKQGRTEFGQVYTLEKGIGMCTLHCEDGDLRMPSYSLHFKEELHEPNQ